VGTRRHFLECLQFKNQRRRLLSDGNIAHVDVFLCLDRAELLGQVPGFSINSV
jgi:hypothetical protein